MKSIINNRSRIYITGLILSQDLDCDDAKADVRLNSIPIIFRAK